MGLALFERVVRCADCPEQMQGRPARGARLGAPGQGSPARGKTTIASGFSPWWGSQMFRILGGEHANAISTTHRSTRFDASYRETL